MTFLSCPIHSSTTLTVLAVDIDLVVDSLLNHSKVALLGSLEPLRFVHHRWNRLTVGCCFTFWLHLFLLFLLMGDEHVFDLLRISNVDRAMSKDIFLVDICSHGQKLSYHSLTAIESSHIEGSVALITSLVDIGPVG